MKPYTISRTSLFLIGVAVIATLRDLPSFAEYGMNVVFFLLISLLFFFLPLTLISVELTTLLPRPGGVYLWVKEAFGDKTGFFVIWLQWIGNIFWFPNLLSFAASSIAYILYPPFAQNQLFMTSTVLITFWGLTFLNTLGLKISIRITTMGTLIGTLLPALFIILLGILWLSSGNQPIEPFTWKGLYPVLDITNVIYLGAVILSFLGMELPAVHVKNIEEPKKSYPRALISAMVVVFFIFLLGSLSLSSVVPKGALTVATGVMQGFEFFFQKYNIGWMTYLFALLTAVGAFATINVWILGPLRAVIVAGQNGDLPPFFHKKNEHGMPTNLLIFQAIVVTLVSLLFLMVSDMQTILWILGLFTGNVYVIMYFLIFSAAVRLRTKYPLSERKGTTQLPSYAFYTLFILGVCAIIFAFITGFIPPNDLIRKNLLLYEIIFAIGILILLCIPFVILSLKKPDWNIHLHEAEDHIVGQENEE